MADRVFDHLVQEFGIGNVFKDVDSIPLGADFRQVIDKELTGTDVFLAIIGPSWVTARNTAGNRRLDSTDDLVRIEIEAALARSITIIPVTIGGASPPTASEIPESIRAICSRQGIAVRPDPDFRSDVARLIRSIHTLRGDNPPARELNQQTDFPEVLTCRAEAIIAYIKEEREAALSAGKSSPEIKREYGNALARFRTLHAKYMTAISQNKPQVAHEILGQVYRLLFERKYRRHRSPPNYCMPD